MAPINRGFLTAGILTVIGTLVVAAASTSATTKATTRAGRCSAPSSSARARPGGQPAHRVLHVDRARRPCRRSPRRPAPGPATDRAVRHQHRASSRRCGRSSPSPVAIGVAIALGGGNIQFSLYLVALTGMGMLATTGVVVSEDTFGPVADNAAGIAEMSGEFEGEPERIMVSLDAVGNTTKAVTKGFAIGSAVIAAVALFAGFIETIGSRAQPRAQTGVGAVRRPLDADQRGRPEDVHRPADRRLDRRSCSRRSPSEPSAARPASSCRRCAASSPTAEIMDGTEKPDYGPVIDICTAASLRELATPALLAVLTPVIIGFGINYLALGAFLAAVILTGQLMANFLSNSGGAWDNAKKYIEDGHEGGKGSEAHKAAVIGDTVGDPFKDTAGPALNPLIKVMNLVSLLILPAVISLRDNDARPLRDRLRRARRAHRRGGVLEAQGGGHGRGPRRSRSRWRLLDSSSHAAALTAEESPR